MRPALFSKKNADWPEENKARAQYYLARILTEGNTNPEEASKLDREAKKTLGRLLSLEDSTAITKHGEQEDYPILFDHLMPWDYRIVVPSQWNER